MAAARRAAIADMTFRQWLSRRRVTLTPRGDLIGHLRRDRTFPAEIHSIYELLGHLVRNRMPASAGKAARGLWRQYAREAARPFW
jgi:hypothetical protein